MTIVCWDHVPSEFHYLRDVVEACGETRIALYDQSLGRHVSFLDTASDDQLDLIRAARDEVERRKDRLRIEQWCQRPGQKTDADSKAVWHVQGILFLFDQLDRQTNGSERKSWLNRMVQGLLRLFFSWNGRNGGVPDDIGVLQHLPKELQYLVRPAFRFGKYQTVDSIFDFLESASVEEQTELQRIAAKCKAGEHYDAVNQFLDEYSMEDYTECAKLYFLFAVLDYADLEF